MINKNVKKTGIPMLDESLKGGIPIGKTLLFYGYPLAENDVFLMQTVYTNLAEGEVCYYVSSNSSPDVVRSGFKEYGWDTSRYSKRFEIVDAYSSLVGASSPERFSVKDPENIKSFDETISAIIEMLSPGDMLMFSSLSSLFDQCTCDDEEVLRYARKWNKMAVLRGGIVVYNFIDRSYDQELTEQVKNGLCNATVLVGGLGAEMIYGHYFRLYSCDWSRLPDRPTLFKITRPGGITVHIPKILITGPQGSGKSTFVRTAAALSAGNFISVDRMGTTIVGDHAQIIIKGFSVDLFGTPGHKRFIPTLKAFAEDAMGIVVVVDSADPRNFECATKMLKRANMEGVPYVIVANKQDSKGALDVDGIREEMGVPGDVPTIGICAKSNGDVQRVLETLIGMVVESPSSRPDEKLGVVINDLKRVNGIRAAAIVSTGGILKAADVPDGVQGERLAFAASTIMSTADAASENLDHGKMGGLVVEIDENKLMIKNAGEKNMLVVLADPGERMGPVSVEVERAVQKIKDILGE